MSTYLITVAPEDSFVHQAGTLLATEFEVTHQKLEISIEQLKMAIGVISPDDSDSIGVLKTLLCKAGLNANFLVKHQNCVVLSDDIVPIDLISINNEDIGFFSEKMFIAPAYKRTVRNFLYGHIYYASYSHH